MRVKSHARCLGRPVKDVDVLVRSRLYMVDELVDDLQRCQSNVARHSLNILGAKTYVSS